MLELEWIDSENEILSVGNNEVMRSIHYRLREKTLTKWAGPSFDAEANPEATFHKQMTIPARTTIELTRKYYQ